MTTRIVLPKLTETMDEGTLVKWMKGEGEHVNAGEILFVLDTDKVAIEVEAPATGVLRRILIKEGEKAPVGTLLAFIGEPDEVLPDVMRAIPIVSGSEETSPQPPVATSKRYERTGAVRAIPAARQLAQQYGLDLTTVSGTGPDGVVTPEDVRRAAEDRSNTQAPVGELVPLSTIRQTVAKRMVESASIPQVTIHSDADLSEVLIWRDTRFPDDAKGHVTVTPIMLRTAAVALRRHPELNAEWTDGGVFRLHRVNIGLAIATEDGLVVPVIHDADRNTVGELARIVADLTERARSRSLRIEDVRGATFTITNLGKYLIRGFTPLVNPPEIAILGIGRVTERPVVHAGQVVIHPIVDLSLTFDHRAIDGAPAAAFLESLVNLLAKPELLDAS